MSNFWKRFAGLSRSWQLLRIFPLEQRDPRYFYNFLAQDTIQLLKLFLTSNHIQGPWVCSQLHDKPYTVLDVGAGPGYFAEVFSRQDMQYIAVEPDRSEISRYGYSDRKGTAICASGYELPIAGNSCDIVLSLNVAEHVRYPWNLAEEMIRVCRPGGIIVISYTVWFGPFGGHETGPWHYFGGRYAARRFAKKNGHLPKNNFGQTLFRLDVRDGLQWARKIDAVGKAKLITAFPRYHPWWAWFIVKIPLLRELFVSNLTIIMRKDVVSKQIR